ncbi:MAG: hypothetical protein H0U54_17345 [Acidobacteria bacterium]|nr:hypothetical protein [Acidobacteriota bacterium]
MKKLSVIYLVCIFWGAGSLANAQSVSKCFRADWLQGERTVNFTIEGSEVTGTFSVVDADDANLQHVATYEFSGTLKGNILTVAFVGDRPPDVAPSEMKSLIWTLSKSGSKESLRIKFRGKNYQTNRYEVRFADFESCDGGTSGYAALASSAKRVQFAAGANSASFPVSFKTKSERKSFLLNMKAGQRLEVEAIGCTITFYYPDKREGEEPSIDTWSPDALTQSGDYLFVITPAPYPGKRTINFKVTN